ncbi:hypothetical protein nbrc107696_16810 [Gordonia spumicola]|uniref:Uncharacterized protein n=1 Tax=Gordonia spumicola TaxID=589161 RepID=A0A7I9V780_9ACTN|nr:hypothetical protein nbrc107696_16810 [Gordonia spumicola]
MVQMPGALKYFSKSAESTRPFASSGTSNDTVPIPEIDADMPSELLVTQLRQLNTMSRAAPTARPIPAWNNLSAATTGAVILDRTFDAAGWGAGCCDQPGWCGPCPAGGWLVGP